MFIAGKAIFMQMKKIFKSCIKLKFESWKQSFWLGALLALMFLMQTTYITAKNSCWSFNTTSSSIPSIQSFMNKLNEYLVRETSLTKDLINLYLLILLKIHVIYNVREWIYTSKICNKLRMLADRFSVICQVGLFYWSPSNWNLNNQIHTTQS